MDSRFAPSHPDGHEILPFFLSLCHPHQGSKIAGQRIKLSHGNSKGEVLQLKQKSRRMYDKTQENLEYRVHVHMYIYI